MRLLQSYEKGGVTKKEGAHIGLSPYPARLKDFPRASATTRSTNVWRSLRGGRSWSAPRREAEHPGPPSALRKVDVLTRDEGFFCYICN